MSKHDLYHKINIEETLEELERVQEEKPWTRPEDDAGQHPDQVKLNPGAGLEEIAAFEEKAGQRLPDDYKTFLQRSNGAYVFGKELYGLKDIEPKPFTYMHGEQDREAREVYAIAHWHTGDDILLNLQAPAGAKDKNRRDIIDRFHEDDKCTVIAKSFGEFLHRIIEGSKTQDENAGADLKERGFDVSPDETFDKSTYWLQEGFKPHRELYGVEFND